MSFLSGMMIPLPLMPHVLTQVAPIWPAYHLLQISLHVVGDPHAGSPGLHAVAVTLEGLAFFAWAQRRLSQLR